MILTYRDLLDSIQARAALLHAAARNRPAADVPPILHADHEPALRRVIDDSAAIVARRLRLILDHPDAHTLRFIPRPDSPFYRPSATDGSDISDGARQLITEALHLHVLHILASALGWPSDHLARADALLSVARPARLTPW